MFLKWCNDSCQKPVNGVMKPFALLLILIAGCAGCCKQLCNDQPLVFQLGNYSSTEIDTILVNRYAPGGSFANKLDSAYYFPLINGADTTNLILTIDRVFENQSDYSITLTSTRDTYFISDIVLSSEKCTCGNGHFKIVGSCSVNGQVQNQRPFHLR